MKITIDTVNDHPEDIKRAIQLLAHFVSKERVHNYNSRRTSNDSNMDSNLSDNQNTNINPVSNNLTNQVPNQKEVPDTPPNFGMLMGLMDGNIPQPESKSIKEMKKEHKEPKVTLF